MNAERSSGGDVAEEAFPHVGQDLLNVKNLKKEKKLCKEMNCDDMTRAMFS